MNPQLSTVSFSTRVGRLLMVISFALLISVPPLVSAWHPELASNLAALELRSAATLPKRPTNLAEAQVYPARLESWINDRFTPRHYLVLLNTLVSVKLLGHSTSPSVAIGQNGWLYYRGDNDFEQARRLVRFTPDQVDRWIDVMERRQAWLAERGIPMLTVVVPNKGRVYPEFLPKWATVFAEPTYLDQIIDRLRERNSNLNLLDLTPGLLRLKSRMQIFLKQDTHWTVEAGYEGGYLPIMDKLKPLVDNIRPTSRDAWLYKIADRDGANLDLARMLGLGAVASETEMTLSARSYHLVSSTQQPFGNQPLHRLISSLKDTPKVLFFRDSFTVTMMPFLHETFGETVFYEHRGMHFNRAVIEAEKPDVVVYQFVERYLSAPVPTE